MKRVSLSVPELMFVIGTRAALAAGVALLASQKLGSKQKGIAGAALVGIGAATTFPAARMVLKNRGLRGRLRAVGFWLDCYGSFGALRHLRMTAWRFATSG